MPMYAYRAIDAGGRIARGRLPAMNLSELESRLQSNGMELLRGWAVRGIAGRQKVPRRELINFCFHMEHTLRAGLLITDALTDQVEGLTHVGFRDALTVVLQTVREGASFSTALNSYPALFDDVFVGMVRSGESSGRLPDAFAKLGASLKWRDELGAQMQKLIMYPAFTVSVLVAVTVFVLVYLVPQLSGFIRSMGDGELPIETRVLLSLSAFMVKHWVLVLSAPFAAGLVLAVLFRFGGERVQLFADRIKLKIPVFGPIVEKIVLSRFCALFGMLYESGLPVLMAIEVGRDAVGNRVIASGLDVAMRDIEQGRSIADAFKSSGLFPNLMLRMVRIGESTGDIDKGLRNVSYFFDREVQETIGRIQSMIEPVLTLVLGLILGWLMMSVLGPVYDLMTRIKV